MAGEPPDMSGRKRKADVPANAGTGFRIVQRPVQTVKGFKRLNSAGQHELLPRPAPQTPVSDELRRSGATSRFRAIPKASSSGQQPSVPAPVEREPLETLNRTQKPSVIMTDFKDNWAKPLLDIMHEREHDSRFWKSCPRCMYGIAEYKCFECFQVRPLCKACILDAHKHNPFHDVDFWNGRFLDRVSLASLGLVIYLGHDGGPCPLSRGSAVETTIVHAGGIRQVPVVHCRCRSEEKGSAAMSLWRDGLFPASFVRPRTAFTAGALRDFQLLSLTTKATSSAYCTYLRRKTDYWSKDTTKDRAREFFSAFRMYSFLDKLGSTGVDLPAQGEEFAAGALATLCPACPQPGINMTPGWETRPDHLKFLDAKISTRDGNFSIGQKDKAMDHEDVPLTLNAMYFVHQGKMGAVMLDQCNDVVPVDCNNFKALDYHGMRSGIVSHFCPHDMFEANGTADLVKGERFVSVDFAVVSSHQRYLGLPLFIEAYDIVCKWWTRFFERLRTNKLLLSEFPGVADRWPRTITAVGKYHIVNHNDDCRRLRDIHLLPGTGQVDGDNAERVWAVQGRIAPSVKEMGVGAREDNINMHFDDWNKGKSIDMADSLDRKMRTARKECEAQRRLLDDLRSNAAQELISAWETEVKTWIASIIYGDGPPKGLSSPYELSKEKAPTLRQVQAALRADGEVQGLDDAVGSGKSVVDMIKVGLDIEQQQSRLRTSASNASTDAQLQDLNDKRDGLMRRIRSWSSWQKSTYATLFQLEGDGPPLSVDELAEDVKLRLPNAYKDDLRYSKSDEFIKLIALEHKLREARAHEAIRSLRKYIAVRSKMNADHPSGTSQKTRHISSLERVRAGVDEWREYYSLNYGRLVSLGLPIASYLRPLTESDTRDLKLRGAHMGSSRNTVSWIWGKVGDDEEVPENELESWAEQVQKVEYNLCAARVQRWTEQVLRLEEDMRRTLRFFSFHAAQWLSRGRLLTGKTGAAAYCARRADDFRKLTEHARQRFERWISQEDIIAACSSDPPPPEDPMLLDSP